MIAINNLSFYFGDRPLYDNLSWHIKPKSKIALIGANGTGKTTLLRLITGQFQPNEGNITMAKDCTIGYLNQDLLSYETEKSIRDVTLEAFEEVMKLEEEIEEILSKLETEKAIPVVNRFENLDFCQDEKVIGLCGLVFSKKMKKWLTKSSKLCIRFCFFVFINLKYSCK